MSDVKFTVEIDTYLDGDDGLEAATDNVKAALRTVLAKMVSDGQIRDFRIRQTA